MDFSRTPFFVSVFIVRLCNWHISAGSCLSSISISLHAGNHQWWNSQESKDYPLSPSLTVSPSQPVYDNGQKITLMCSPPNSTDVEGIRYFKNSTEIHLDENKETMTYYTMVISKKMDEGVYFCGYWVIINGLNIQSYGSNRVKIMITDTTPSWHYYIAGSIVFFAVSLLSCLLYKRAQKRKSPNRVPAEAHLSSSNPRHCISKEPVNNSALSPLFQNQLNNPLYSVLYQYSIPANEELLLIGANTEMMTDSGDHVPESFKTSSASAIFSQAQEEAHIYSEIVTKIY